MTTTLQIGNDGRNFENPGKEGNESVKLDLSKIADQRNHIMKKSKEANQM